MLRFARLLPAVAILACVFGFVGCSKEKGAKVTGVLLEDGQPLRLAERERVDLSMVPIRVDEASVKANPGAEIKRDDASFTFVGPGLGLVPFGEYKICLTVRSREGTDRFQGQFSADNTPLTYTVAEQPKQEIVIDIAKKTVTRK